MRQYGSRAAPVDTWASTLACTGFDWRGQPVLVLRLMLRLNCRVSTCAICVVLEMTLAGKCESWLVVERICKVVHVLLGIPAQLCC